MSSLIRTRGMNRDDIVIRPLVRGLADNQTRDEGSYDPYWRNVVLFHDYVTDGTDQSLTRKPDPTAHDGAAVNNGELDLPGGLGASAAGMDYADHADFEVGADAYTWEWGWRFDVVQDTTDTTMRDFMAKFNATTNNREWIFLFRGDGATGHEILWGYSTNGLTLTDSDVFAIPTPVVGARYDYAVTRTDAGVWYFHINGGLVRTWAAGDETIFSGTALMTLGNRIDHNAATGSPDGKYDYVRLTKGVARYGAKDYTPKLARPYQPVDVENLFDDFWNDVELLVDAEEAALTDKGPKSRGNPTIAGSAGSTTTDPISGTRSGTLTTASPSSNDRVWFADQDNHSVGTADFSYEITVEFSDVPDVSDVDSIHDIANKWNATTNDGDWLFLIRGDGASGHVIGLATALQGQWPTVQSKTWDVPALLNGVEYHLAWDRQGDNVWLYINGRSQGVRTGMAGQWSEEVPGLSVAGARVDSTPLQHTRACKWDNVRVTYGVARWQGANHGPVLPQPQAFN